MVVTNDELFAIAESVLNPKLIGKRYFGDVASTLLTDQGNVYSEVSIDTHSGTGFCAEHSAIAAMVTAGEYRIERIVLVWKSKDGALYVLPPCGRCRESFARSTKATSGPRLYSTATTL
jgi:cytidine deaminase